MTVKLRFVELDSNKIFNWLNPENVTCFCNFGEWHDIWWEPEIVKRRKEFGKIWTEEFNKITGHFSKLEDSILKNGINHPISAVTGPLRGTHLDGEGTGKFFPPNIQSDIQNAIYSHTFGGSRLTIAQKHGMIIPCAVHDFSNLFENEPEMLANNYTKWCSANYNFTGAMPYLRLRMHSHLADDRKYSGMNNETRIAQREASKIAKEIINEQYNLS